jgi:Secretion system C-terminal sorting domain
MRILLICYLLILSTEHSFCQRLLPPPLGYPEIEMTPSIAVWSLSTYGTSILVGGDFENFFEATTPDLCLYNGASYSSFEPALDISMGNNVIYNTLVINEDILAAGLLPAYNGLARYSNGNWLPFGPDTTSEIRNVFHYSDGYVCLASTQIFRFDGNAWSAMPSPSNEVIRDIAVHNNRLYVATNDEVYAFDQDDWTPIEVAPLVDIELSVANDMLFCGGFDTTNFESPSAVYYTLDQLEYFPFSFDFLQPEIIGTVFYLDNKFVLSNWRDHINTEDVDRTIQVDKNCAYQEFSFSISSSLAYQNLEHVATNTFNSFAHRTYHREEGCPYLENSVQVTYQTANASTIYTPQSLAGHLIKLDDEQLIGTIYSSSLWLSAVTDSDTIVTADRFTFSNNRKFGPISDSIDYDYYYKYDRVFRVDQEMIDYHLTHYGEASYELPLDIRDWPAHGDISNGESQHLAPFKDLDEDGIYEPQFGDYPAIKGDQCAYYIINDKRPSLPMNVWYNLPDSLAIEEHVMEYLFNDGPIAIQNTLFMEHRLINRSNQVYHQMACGIWSDFDIGGSSDDYIGTDSLRQCVYAYNADANDQANSQSLGFGSMPYSSGCVLLNTNMVNSMYHKIGSDPIMGEPLNTSQYFHYLTGRWKNGDSLYFGGNGHSGQGVTEIPAHFVFPTEPLSVDPEGWSESSAGNLVGDRRVIANFQIEQLAPEESICVHYAFVDARADQTSEMPHLESVTKLLERTDSVIAFYNSNLADCMLGAITSIPQLTVEPLAQFTVYPNPGNHLLHIRLPIIQTNGALTIYHVEGKIVLQENISPTNGHYIIDTLGLPQGLYVVEWDNGKTKERLKWVKAQ